MLRLMAIAALVWLVPQATPAPAPAPVVLHIKIVLIDAERNATPVPRHALLISDNPASAPPRLIVTTVDGTADVRLRPGNYTVESDRPVTFHGKAYEWRQTLDVVAGREAVLELTAENAEVTTAPAAPAATEPAGSVPPLEADPAFLLPKWKDSVVALWTPTARASGFVIDASGLVATSQRVIGTDTSIEVQITPTVKLVASVLASDPERDVAVLWIDPKAIASVKPVPLDCAQRAGQAIASGDEIFAIGAALRGPKDMASGPVTRVDAHRILADVTLAPGSAGGPAFTARGDLVGVTSLVQDQKDGSGRTAQGESRIVPASAACEVVAAAGQKMKAATAPSAAPLPVEPAQPFPVDALRGAAKRGAISLTSYQLSSSTFDVTFITPLLTYAARYQADTPRPRTTSADTRKPEPEPARTLVQPLMDFANWSDYVSDFPPVLLIRVTPRMVEGFWTKVARGAAQTQGVSIPAIKRLSSGFSRLRAFCGDKEVTPIHPFKIEQRVPTNDETIYEGLYAFEPGALVPECGTVKLVLYAEKEPDKADTRVVDAKVIQQVWQDFASYRAAMESK